MKFGYGFGFGADEAACSGVCALRNYQIDEEEWSTVVYVSNDPASQQASTNERRRLMVWLDDGLSKDEIWK